MTKKALFEFAVNVIDVQSDGYVGNKNLYVHVWSDSLIDARALAAISFRRAGIENLNMTTRVVFDLDDGDGDIVTQPAEAGMGEVREWTITTPTK